MHFSTRRRLKVRYAMASANIFRMFLAPGDVSGLESSGVIFRQIRRKQYSPDDIVFNWLKCLNIGSYITMWEWFGPHNHMVLVRHGKTFCDVTSNKPINMHQFLCINPTGFIGFSKPSWVSSTSFDRILERNVKLSI